MPEKVELKIGAIKIENFIGYQIDADLYTAADAFHVEFSDPGVTIKAGDSCDLIINGDKELKGIIDKVQKRVRKNGVFIVVEGRDLMGWVVDAYCEPPWVDVTGMKLKTLAEKLLAKAPSKYFDLKNIDYQENVVGKFKGKKAKGGGNAGYIFAQDGAQKIGRIEAGMTVFEVLKNYAFSRGILFYCTPEGQLIFGRPMAKGAPQYSLTMLKSGVGNNVIESDVVYDISQRYSKVTVIGQQQGNDSMSFAAEVNTSNTGKPAIDDTFPFYKPYVVVDNNDDQSPTQRAKMIMEKQRREGEKLIYKVGRHQQNGKNWAINTICHIKDEIQGIDGDYLIYGRTFELSKQEGPTTRLSLGVPGLIA
ncbi:prophage tail protein [hydrocarbon metagenome]|uniref:Prophage tail protein n=1 Tax=hydrocarbon metagenome TaxID=938273 RepID=A0A0W8FWE0_9ZZZZ